MRNSRSLTVPGMSPCMSCKKTTRPIPTMECPAEMATRTDLCRYRSGKPRARTYEIRWPRWQACCFRFLHNWGIITKADRMPWGFFFSFVLIFQHNLCSKSHGIPCLRPLITPFPRLSFLICLFSRIDFFPWGWHGSGMTSRVRLASR